MKSIAKRERVITIRMYTRSNVCRSLTSGLKASETPWKGFNHDQKNQNRRFAGI